MRSGPLSIDLGKDSIDIGIVVRDGEAALKFYRDTLGLEHVADTPMPGGGTMHRLMCGTTLVKVIERDEAPEKAQRLAQPRRLPIASPARCQRDRQDRRRALRHATKAPDATVNASHAVRGAPGVRTGRRGRAGGPAGRASPVATST